MRILPEPVRDVEVSVQQRHAEEVCARLREDDAFDVRLQVDTSNHFRLGVDPVQILACARGE